MAIIFDNDGTLIDSSHVHSSIESELLRKYGARISTQELELRYSGMSLKDIFEEVNKEHELSCSFDTFLAEKITLLEQHIPSIQVVQGVHALLDELDKQAIPYAIASGGRREYIDNVLESTGLSRRIPVSVSAWEVANGKPAPDVFLEAAKRLGVQPTSCVVVEDGRSGMIGAKKGGMKVIGIGKEHKDFADAVVESFADITIDLIRNVARNK